MLLRYMLFWSSPNEKSVIATSPEMLLMSFPCRLASTLPENGSHSVFAHGSKVIDKLRRNVKDRRLDGVVVGYDRAHKIL